MHSTVEFNVQVNICYISRQSVNVHSTVEFNVKVNIVYDGVCFLFCAKSAIIFIMYCT